jgi:hypothetical protein
VLSLRALLLFVGAVLVVGPVASAGPPERPKPKDPPLDLRITATGPVGFDCWQGSGFPNCNPPIFKIFGTAPAEGTFIGKHGTFSTVEQATPQPPSYAENVIDGHAVVTRKNGDKLYIHYTGLSPAPNPDETGVGHLDDDLEFVIEGGTGRFENASGSGRLTATGDVFYDTRPTIVSSQLKGTITLKHRDHHDDQFGDDRDD